MAHPLRDLLFGPCLVQLWRALCFRNNKHRTQQSTKFNRKRELLRIVCETCVPDETQGAYGTADLFLTYARDNWSIEAFARNLTNTVYLTFAQENARWVGLSVFVRRASRVRSAPRDASGQVAEE